MRDKAPGAFRDQVADHLHNMKSDDHSFETFDRSLLSEEDIDQIRRLMKAMIDLRETEQAILAASEKYMKLTSQDMRALHYLILAKKRGEVVTPSIIAAFLEISPASTTKLLNRLERAGHITRELHHSDRRAFAIHIAPETEASAKQTVGKQHAKRINAAARLTGEERETVIRFLKDMEREISMENADWATP